jgi:hypothetical protein
MGYAMIISWIRRRRSGTVSGGKETGG